MKVTDGAIICLLMILNVHMKMFFLNSNFVHKKVIVMLITSSMWIFSLNAITVIMMPIYERIDT